MLRPLRDLYKHPLLRRWMLPLFERLNPGDILIRHHYTGRPLRLHSYRHKGYWFHGRRREELTMKFFRDVIRPDDCVVEVGGHIGYISMYFADLVGPRGRVIVFEPGTNNLPYIRQNVHGLAQITLVEQAVSNEDGTARFFEEGLTGQNNSLHADYSVFDENRRRAFSKASYDERAVTTVRLDTFVADSSIHPAFIKIDIEGAELLALEGMQRVLATDAPIVLVEVSNKKREVYELLERLGYWLFNDTGQRLSAPEQLPYNVCALNPKRHDDVIRRLGWRAPVAR